jgi:hypothetical protein
MFGMRPLGFNSFNCTPRLPAAWNEMALRNIHSFGKIFDLEVKRSTGKNNNLTIIVKADGKEKSYSIKEGATQLIVL